MLSAPTEEILIRGSGVVYLRAVFAPMCCSPELCPTVKTSAEIQIH